MMTFHNDKKYYLNDSEHLIPLLMEDICKIIHEKLGIVVKPDNQDLIKFIIKSSTENANDLADYINKLKISDANSIILKQLIATITIGETYFFRDKKQMDALQQFVIPNIIKKKIASDKKTLRVWSAGCSSGEEIYTMIIMFNELLPELSSWNYQFLATDINTDSLSKAIEGRFRSWSMRAIPRKIQDKYFDFDGRDYIIKNEIKNKATFEYLNLNSNLYPSLLNGTSDQDLILCRNVLIYFDIQHVSSIIEKLSSSLCDNGFLLLGASDPCLVENTKLSNSNIIPSLWVKSSILTKSITSKQVNIRKPAMTVSMVPRKSDIKFTKSHDMKSIKSKIDLLESQSKWDEIISVVNASLLLSDKESSLYVTKANALANLGKTKEALEECEKCLRNDPLNAEAYFIKALILSEMQKPSEAEKSFRKALFINPDFLICRYQLGLFLIRHNRHENGIQMLKNVLEKSKSFDMHASVPRTHDMNYSDLTNLLESEIKIHEDKYSKERL